MTGFSLELTDEQRELRDWVHGAGHREAFGRPIVENQSIAFALADMRTESASSTAVDFGMRPAWMVGFRRRTAGRRWRRTVLQDPAGASHRNRCGAPVCDADRAAFPWTVLSSRKSVPAAPGPPHGDRQPSPGRTRPSPRGYRPLR